MQGNLGQNPEGVEAMREPQKWEQRPSEGGAAEVVLLKVCLAWMLATTSPTMAQSVDTSRAAWAARPTSWTVVAAAVD